MSGSPVQTVTSEHPGFPRRLRTAREILSALPASLDVRGDLAGAERVLAVAIVGARAAFASDLVAAERLATEVVGRGGVVISGGAIGVDSAAHRGALAAGGPTVAVLGSGIDVVYPWRNRGLFEQIARSGAVVSRFPRDLTPRAGTFVSRNAIIAALADVVVVVGAGESSGALHTVAAARRLGRLLGAVPGRSGCDRLIADGAAIVESGADLDRLLAGEPRRPVVTPPPRGTDAQRVLDALHERVPRDLEDLAAFTGLAVGAAQRAVADLELRGLALLAPGQAYLRSPLAAGA